MEPLPLRKLRWPRPFISIALCPPLGDEFAFSPGNARIRKRIYALSRASAELLINCQWELPKVEQTGDTMEDTADLEISRAK